MATPITWQNINAPSFGEANRLMGQAQQSILGAFDGAKTALADSQAFDKELWKRQDQEATQDALGKIYQAQNVDQFNALNQSGVLDQAVAANGARIDRAQVNALRESRPSELQKRAVADIQYRDTMLDDAQANDVRRINTLALTDPAAASAELAKNPDLRKSFEIAKNIDASAQTQVERERAKTRFGFDMNDEQRKAAAEAQNVLLRPIALRQADAQVGQTLASTLASRASAAASNESVLNSQANRTRLEEEAGRAVERQRLATALEGNIYAEGIYKDSNTVDLAKIMKDFEFASKNNDTAAIRSDITSRLNKLARDGIKVKGPDGKEETLPIPLGAVKAALLASNGDYWLDGNYGNNFEKELRARLQGVRSSPTPAAMNANSRLRLPFPAATTQGAENPALNDWLAFKNITRSSAEVAPASRK